MKKYFLPLLMIVVIAVSCGQQENKNEETSTTVVDSAKEREVWSKEKANDWYATKGWLAGSNFTPSTAINQLEFWQAETFDTATINSRCNCIVKASCRIPDRGEGRIGLRKIVIVSKCKYNTLCLCS